MRTITVYEIAPRNYKKDGTLKKKAVSEMSLTLSSHLDGKDHTPDNIQYVAGRILQIYGRDALIESPYFFTHILITVPATARQYAIYERVLVAGQMLTTSPTALLEALTRSANAK